MDDKAKRAGLKDSNVTWMDIEGTPKKEVEN